LELNINDLSHVKFDITQRTPKDQPSWRQV